jgi:peptide methionine sulfoxide reductase msrA/msrB
LTDTKEKGTYLCRNCGVPLFKDTSKFLSGCGWPSFDEEIPGSVERMPDKDGRRTEIVCCNCKGHLGHVFHGEGLTKKNTRHCVNSASIDFVPFTDVKSTDEVILAAGCFWGVEHLLKKLPGVLLTEIGYSGGQTPNPTYKEVCSKNTGHLEVVRVIFETEKLNLEKLLKYFLEIHDPYQKDGQGPDIGEQYLSAIFYYNDEQKKEAEKLLGILSSKGKQVATTVQPAKPFYIGEEYHQNYYEKKGSQPYCHKHVKRFDN